ncbi:MAG: hypothetical protein L0Y64_23555 [Myxococcaceae bacterium]|nr:hypothetical protein [Myxococcaceae bacterium]
MRQFLVVVTVLLLPALHGCVRHVAVPREGRFEEPPPGMVEVDAVSDDDGQVWEVSAGGSAVCTTPCTQRFGVHETLRLESNDGDYVQVRGLGAEALQARRALLVAEGTSHGKQVNGIVFTTLGSMGLVTAITLTAVGCSDLSDRRGMCSAGLITGAASLPLTAAALWMLLDSGPKAHVLPIATARSAKGQPPVRVALLPNGAVGTF